MANEKVIVRMDMNILISLILGIMKFNVRLVIVILNAVKDLREMGSG
jgi:hypothetical protein